MFHCNRFWEAEPHLSSGGSKPSRQPGSNLYIHEHGATFCSFRAFGKQIFRRLKLSIRQGLGVLAHYHANELRSVCLVAERKIMQFTIMAHEMPVCLACPQFNCLSRRFQMRWGGQKWVKNCKTFPQLCSLRFLLPLFANRREIHREGERE
jgi:hypothetical protein